jgi:enoyl-CoA hydratase/carnithine racemase
MREFKTLTIDISDQVATLTLLSRRHVKASPDVDGHVELASALTALREDDGVRVVVVTGMDGQFKVPPPRSHYGDGSDGGNFPLTDPRRSWRTFGGIIRVHQTMAEMEKPIIAKVNGDAIGFGQSIAFACDLIVANETAHFMDHHMGGTFVAEYDGEMREGGHEEFSSVPGDGGLALMPLHMSLCKAKEYLMLAEPCLASDLARLGIINYAVPAAELDAKVEDLVRRLLKRGAYALAWTKRVANRRLVDHLNLTLDAGVAYEMISFLQREKVGGRQPTSL